MIEKQENIPERAVLAALYSKEKDDLPPETMLGELASLVSAAGGQTVGQTFQMLRRGSRPSPATLVGKGKAQEIAEIVEMEEAEVVVFDNELSPPQIRELEKLVGKRVIDRSELILDIFATRARTKEAKLQVELAQLQYTAPRLRGMWSHLERQAGSGGSMGLKGPGEKQIEIDRRIINSRVAKLRGEIATLHKRKQREVSARAGRGFCVSLVGYTNAGKSTLLNRLTEADTYSADQLFATLDTKTRRWRLSPGQDVMLSDTVGFVRNLPHHLVASFRSTLEEAVHADLLMHVIDVSHPHVETQIDAVDDVLKQLEAANKPTIHVLNKVECVTDPDMLLVLRARLKNAIEISALTGQGIEALHDKVAEMRKDAWMRVVLKIAAHAGKALQLVKTYGVILKEDFEDNEWLVEAELSKHLLGLLYKIPGAVVVEKD